MVPTRTVPHEKTRVDFLYLMLASFKLAVVELDTDSMYAKGRKGKPSILDTIVFVLEEQSSMGEESMSLAAIHTAVQKQMGYPVSSSSVRSAIYKSNGVFTPDKRVGRSVFYKLASGNEGASS